MPFLNASVRTLGPRFGLSELVPAGFPVPFNPVRQPLSVPGIVAGGPEIGVGAIAGTTDVPLFGVSPDWTGLNPNLLDQPGASPAVPFSEGPGTARIGWEDVFKPGPSVVPQASFAPAGASLSDLWCRVNGFVARHPIISVGVLGVAYLLLTADAKPPTRGRTRAATRTRTRTRRTQ